MHQLASCGITYTAPGFDMMVAGQLLNTTARIESADELAQVHLHRPATSSPTSVMRGVRSVPSSPRELVQQAIDRAQITFDLVPVLTQKLASNSQLKLFHDVEMPLLSCLFDMESTGVTLDAPYLTSFSRELAGRIEAVETQIFAVAGHRLNVGSPSQVTRLLFEELGLPKDDLHKTYRGENISTSAWSLDALKGTHPVIALVLEHRELAKLKGTYVDGLLSQIRSASGRLHCTFNQSSTVTGRMSSSNPNLQSIPVISELGKRVRKAFVSSHAGVTGSESGGVLIAADYSQAELRMFAHMANDTGLIHIFEQGIDAHAHTASLVLGKPIGQITKKEREQGKRFNYSLAFGQSMSSFASDAGMTHDEGKAFFARYFRAHPKLQAWIASTKQLARQQGYVETMLGRRRYLPRLQPGSGADRAAIARAERRALNSPIQGSAADYIKLAMIHLNRRLRDGGFAARLILSVHDELVVDSPKAEAADVIQIVRQEMEHAYPMRVPMHVDIAVGPNWADAA